MDAELDRDSACPAIEATTDVTCENAPSMAMEDALETACGDGPSPGAGASPRSAGRVLPAHATATDDGLDGVEAKPALGARRSMGELSRGEILGRYVVLERLGAGAMGVVYSAYDPDLDRRVAIKLLRQVSSSRGSGTQSLERARLLREAQALARLSHPNVVAVFDVGEWQEQVFVAMEFVAGDTLRAWMERAAPSRADTLAVFREAARGLIAAHAAGLVHRDFKPDNVMVGTDGRVRVMDFGLARSETAIGVGSGSADSQAYLSATPSRGDHATPSLPLVSASRDEETLAAAGLEKVAPRAMQGSTANPGRPQESQGEGSGRSNIVVPSSLARGLGSIRTESALRLTQDGAILGTPAYMAPEQFLGLVADSRSDQYSFCVALWEALAGSRPYGAKGYFELVAAVTGDEPPVWPTQVQVPGRLRSALHRGLCREPEGRYADLQALLNDLEEREGQGNRPLLLASFLVAALCSALVLVAWTVSRAQAQELCNEDTALSEEVWSPLRGEAVARALDATGLTFAIEGKGAVIQALDTYATEWREGWRDSCQATHLRHEQSESMLDLRTACLRERSAALRATVDVLEQSDATVAKNAVRLVESLPSLAACADLGGLSQQDEKLSPEQRELDAELRESLAIARVADLAGQSDRAINELTPLLARAEATDLLSTRAEIHSAMALAWQGRGEDELAIRSLQESFAAAGRARSDEVAAEAASMLALLYTIELEDLARGEPWLLVADLHVELAGTSAATASSRSHIEHTRAVLAEKQFRFVDAVAHLDRAIDHLRSADRSNVHTELSIMVARGSLEIGRNDYAEATRWLEDSLALSEAKLGARHPTTAAILNNLGVVYSYMNEPQRAVPVLERALDIEAEVGGRHTADYQGNVVNLAMVLDELGQCARAVPMIEGALVSLRGAVTKDTPEIARAEENLAASLSSCGRLEKGRAHQQMALRIYEETVGAQHREATSAKLTLAELLEGLDDIQGALTATREAADVLGDASDPSGLGQRAWGLVIQERLCSLGHPVPRECAARDQQALERLCLAHPDLAECPERSEP